MGMTPAGYPPQAISEIGCWHHVSTAPRDGTRILAYGLLGLESEYGVGTVKWDDFRKHWQLDPNEASEYDPEACTVSHWMPLPAKPDTNS